MAAVPILSLQARTHRPQRTQSSSSAPNPKRVDSTPWRFAKSRSGREREGQEPHKGDALDGDALDGGRAEPLGDLRADVPAENGGREHPQEEGEIGSGYRVTAEPLSPIVRLGLFSALEAMTSCALCEPEAVGA